MGGQKRQIVSVLLRFVLPLALGGACTAAVYARFYSGWMRVEDLPLWPAYIGYFALSAALWFTGWAQVHGWRGDTSIPARVEHDLYYLHHWPLGLDLRILWMTMTN